ncbi:MAG: Calx-beta domain-containing protein, partial [Pseudomonadota bacterium]
FEPDEVYLLSLSNAVNSLIVDDLGRVTIANDDAADNPVFISDAGSLNEGSTFSFVVSLASPAVSGITIAYNLGDGSATSADSDYDDSGLAEISIAAGTSQFTLAVPSIQDIQFEVDEDFFVSLTSAPAGYSITDGLGIATIVNDDVLEFEFISASESFFEDISQAPYFGKTALSSYAGFNCTIDKQGSAHCWGEGSQRALGNTSNGLNDAGLPVEVDDGDSLGVFRQISAGQDHACAIGSEGRVYCWGSGTNSKLGNGTTSGSSFTPVLVSFGDNPGGFRVLSAGADHTCGIGTDNQAYCWGYGFAGALGGGSLLSESEPAVVSLGASTGAYKQISAGGDHTCAIGNDDRVYCWGA